MLIETKGLKKIYSIDGSETPAVNGINLEIKEGEFVAIIGPSGSGKSTLLQILGCLDRPTGGEYFFDGKEIEKYSDDELAHLRNKKFGFVFQSFNLLGRLSVLENVELPLIYAGIPELKRREMAVKVIGSVGLSDRVDFETMRLSGGQKQRVAIARALVNEPRIIFADEPTGNLDSKSGEIILEFFEKLHEDGHTIVLVTHETYLAESAERIIYLKDGLIEREEIVNHKSFRENKFSK
ncbi:MAG: ABC transporter ATP-binding protein [Candidatus Wolfebacteria bacterium]|nr:ABC transporter ATP-binding protein [Candidatus Wolfebacteria bacterium]